MKKQKIFILLALATLILAGCQRPWGDTEQTAAAEKNDRVVATGTAEAYCEKNDGVVELTLPDKNGQQAKVCTFQDNSDCNLFDFFNQKCFGPNQNK